MNAPAERAKVSPSFVSNMSALPDEIRLLTLEKMPTKEVLALAEAVLFIKPTVNSFDFIRTRELQNICLKKSYLGAKLSIGIAIAGGYKPVRRSQFDLVSQGGNL